MRRWWQDPDYRGRVMESRRAAYKRRAKTPVQRLAQYTNVGDGCWTWTGPHTPRGYGMVGSGNQKEYAHRLSYQLFVGEIPEGFEVCHHCDDPSCVNPGHLFVGTRADNMQDAKRKGRVRNKCWRPGDTQCQRGHPWDERNTYVSPRGVRYCRKCAYAAVERYEQRKRANAI